MGHSRGSRPPCSPAALARARAHDAHQPHMRHPCPCPPQVTVLNPSPSMTLNEYLRTVEGLKVRGHSIAMVAACRRHGTQCDHGGTRTLMLLCCLCQSVKRSCEEGGCGACVVAMITKDPITGKNETRPINSVRAEGASAGGGQGAEAHRARRPSRSRGRTVCLRVEPCAFLFGTCLVDMTRPRPQPRITPLPLAQPTSSACTFSALPMARRS